MVSVFLSASHIVTISMLFAIIISKECGRMAVLLILALEIDGYIVYALVHPECF